VIKFWQSRFSGHTTSSTIIATSNCTIISNEIELQFFCGGIFIYLTSYQGHNKYVGLILESDSSNVTKTRIYN